MAFAGPVDNTSQKILPFPKNERGLRYINVGERERLISIVAGIPVTIIGLTRRLPRGVIPTLLGGLLIYRGVTGHSFLYRALGVSTVERSPSAITVLPDGKGIEIKRAVTINRSSEDLYLNWHDFKNATRFMEYVESVQVIDERHSHWVTKTPLVGIAVEWDAEITYDEPGKLIAWKTTRGSFMAPTSGSVHFEPKSNGRGTVVRLEIEYRQLHGPIGVMLGNMLGQIPEQMAREDLERFKELMEAGEIATTEGQPSGRRV